MKKRTLALSLGIFFVLVFSSVLLFSTAYVVPVLMYHSLDDNYNITKLSVSPRSFERQMEFLNRHHYSVIGLDRAIPYIERREKTPPRTIVITFDDGYYNNYKYAYPVLKKYNIPATIFVITDKVGTPGYLGWKEIEEMANSGVITIGSHTISHLWLPSLDQKELDRELKGSREILEKHLGKKVDQFCYPVGAFDERVEKAVKDAGYSCAVATNPGRFKPVNDIYAIKRIKISRTSDNLFVFFIETSGVYTWIKEHRDE